MTCKELADKFISDNNLKKMDLLVYRKWRAFIDKLDDVCEESSLNFYNVLKEICRALLTPSDFQFCLDMDDEGYHILFINKEHFETDGALDERGYESYLFDDDDVYSYIYPSHECTYDPVEGKTKEEIITYLKNLGYEQIENPWDDED